MELKTHIHKVFKCTFITLNQTAKKWNWLLCPAAAMKIEKKLVTEKEDFYNQHHDWIYVILF